MTVRQLLGAGTGRQPGSLALVTGKVADECELGVCD